MRVVVCEALWDDGCVPLSEDEPRTPDQIAAMRRSVSFSKSSMIRMTEIIAEPSSPVPVELKTDHEAAMRNEDGPRPAATLLDDLIVVSHRSLKVVWAVLVSV